MPGRRELVSLVPLLPLLPLVPLSRCNSSRLFSFLSEIQLFAGIEYRGAVDVALSAVILQALVFGQWVTSPFFWGVGGWAGWGGWAGLGGVGGGGGGSYKLRRLTRS